MGSAGICRDPRPGRCRLATQSCAAPDATAELQRLIDTQDIARLPAGVFHISASLHLKRGQGIIGAGAGRTVIVAEVERP
ncbi:MAG: hypothetical protein WDO12_09350 [Pseudomonadota bacterium]